MDLSKAFDTINHNILIAKHQAHGISNDSLKLQFSYFQLDPDPSRADSFTVEGRTSQLEFDSANNRRNSSPKTIQANSGKGNKQPVRRI